MRTLLRLTPLILIVLTSCSTYRQHVMFKEPESAMLKAKAQAESEYLIKPNDILSVQIYTNGGEKLADPNAESFKDGKVSADSATPSYTVATDGTVKLPLLGPVKLEGLTMRQAEEALQKEYEKYYQQPFVSLSFINKRVVVLGAGGGQVIPLTSAGMKLTEVLALSKSTAFDLKANNIRVIRDNKAYVCDLSTVTGIEENNMLMQPDDVVYVEPIRRPVVEGLRDYSPVIQIVTAIGTLIAILISVR